MNDTMMCLKANASKTYHLGIGDVVSLSTITRAKDNNATADAGLLTGAGQ
ncbi:MAG: hypothetical protein KF746_23910 [Chitinophagaceae bacterium]|nr:hypothetical protein [Chitinophagaceae bacterium]